MGEPLASAVIITYNQEKFIEQTIECAIAQKTDFDYEIIIGEDCSTDRTREICLLYQDKYPEIIRVITSDKNVGLLDNWYRSVKAARGKYIAGCGGDDYWHNQEKLQGQVDFLENNPNYGMVHSDADILYQSTGRVDKNIHYARGFVFNNDLEEILTGNRIIASTVTFNKKIFDDKFDIAEIKKNNFLIEDIPLWAEISSCSKIHYMKESLITYRVIDGSISRGKSYFEKIVFFKSCYDCVLYYYDKYIDCLSDKIYILHKIHLLYSIYLFNLAIDANRIDMARKYYCNLVEKCGVESIPCSCRMKYRALNIPFGIVLYKIIFNKIYLPVKNYIKLNIL